MFVKTTARKTKSGTVRYLHLAHSEWDPVAGRSVPRARERTTSGRRTAPTTVQLFAQFMGSVDASQGLDLPKTNCALIAAS